MKKLILCLAIAFLFGGCYPVAQPDRTYKIVLVDNSSKIVVATECYTRQNNLIHCYHQPYQNGEVEIVFSGEAQYLEEIAGGDKQ